MRDLAGKVAVVTGGASGIGRAIAESLAAKGATIAVADLDTDGARRVAKQLEEQGARATAHSVDVSNEDSFRALRLEVLQAHGCVDILVNNAGIAGAPGDFVAAGLDDVRRLLDVNLYGVIYGTSVFLPELLERERASLVNVSSYTGLLGTGSMVGYSTSKFGVRGFTEALRMELAGSPVAVTLVFPGATRTPLMANSPLLHGTQKERLQASLDNARALSADVVADRVVRGIIKGSPRVLTGADTKVLDVITRLAPGRYSAILAKPMRKAIAKTLGS